MTGGRRLDLNLQSFDYKAGVLTSRPPSLDKLQNSLLNFAAQSER